MSTEENKAISQRIAEAIGAGDAAPLRARIPEGYGDTGVQATALIFPTEGCWEVTGKVDRANLTFVVKVEQRK